MANKANLRVEGRFPPHATDKEKEKISYNLTKAFKRLYNESGIANQMKERRFYVKPSEKRRRKKSELKLDNSYDYQNNYY